MSPENEMPPDAPAPATEEVPAALAGVDHEQLEKLRKAVAQFAEGKGTTVSGSEDPDSVPTDQRQGPEAPRVLTGKDVDWTEYDLDFNIAHLYQKAVFRDTPQGPKWVVMLTEYYTDERSLTQHGQKTKKGDPMNLGEFMTQMVNGSDEWHVVGMLPGSTSRGACVFERQYPYVLPDPVQLKKETEVEPPKEEELKRVEDAALDWMAEEGLTPAEESETVEVEEAPDDACGEIFIPPTETLESKALSLNPPSTNPAIVEGNRINPVESLSSGSPMFIPGAAQAADQLSEAIADGTIPILPSHEEEEE